MHLFVIHDIVITAVVNVIKQITGAHGLFVGYVDCVSGANKIEI